MQERNDGSVCLGSPLLAAAQIIHRLSRLVPGNMDRSGLFPFFPKSFVRFSFMIVSASIFMTRSGNF